MQSIKKQTPKIVTTSVDPSDAFKVAIVAAETTSKASLAFCAAGIAYMLNACHLQPEKERDTVQAARDHLEKELDNRKSVGDQMLWRYLQVITKGFNTISDAGKFPAVVQAFAAKTTAQAGADYILHVITHDWGVTSMNKLRDKLGINTGHGPARKDPIADRVTRSLSNFGKEIAKSPAARKETQLPKVAAAIANATPVDALLETIMASLSRLAELDTVSPTQVMRLADKVSAVVAAVTAKAKLRKMGKAKAPEGKVNAAKAAAAKATAKAAAKPATVTAH